MNDRDRSIRKGSTPEVEVEYPDQSPTPRFMVQDYWVDLLGGLLPGTLISVAAFVSIAPTAMLLLNSLSLDYKTSLLSMILHALTAAQSTPSMIWFGVATILFSLFYVLGHMFYRQDPKTPNQNSFANLKDEIANKHENKGKSKAEMNEILEKELECKTEKECEFPFPYFDKYLQQRGLNYLRVFVPWAEHTELRTKNYVNILKMRLRFYFPNRCGTIIRNEAHVRLASSTWYAGGAMFHFSKIAIVMASSSLFLSLAGLGIFEAGVSAKIAVPNILSQHAGAIMVAVLIFYLGKYVRTRVEKFLHYQRMREVVHVMGTAYTAFKRYPDLMCPPFCRQDESIWQSNESVATDKK